MSKLISIILTFLVFNLYASTVIQEGSLLLKAGKFTKAIIILENRYNETENLEEQGEIAYLLSLRPNLKTKKSMSYYIQNALLKYPSIDAKNKARLTRVLADKEFEVGNLKKALHNYNLSLGMPENNKLKDYLTLQKTWVLINLKRENKALELLYTYITNENSHIIGSMTYDFGRLLVENISNKFDLKKITAKEDLINGIFSAISRTGIRPKKVLPILLSNDLYNQFYSIGINSKRISSYNNCSLLKWPLPQQISTSDLNSISKELIKCKNENHNISDIYMQITSKDIISSKLALLSIVVGNVKNACSQYQNILKKSYHKEAYTYLISNCLNDKVSTNILSYTRQTDNKQYIETLLSDQRYFDAVLDRFEMRKTDNITFKEILLTKILIKKGELPKKLLSKMHDSLYYDSIIYCFFYSIKCNNTDIQLTNRYLSKNQRIIYTLNFLKEKNFSAVNQLIALDPNLIKEGLIASEIYLHAEHFPKIYNERLFGLLSSKKFKDKYYISRSNERKLIKSLPKKWKDSINTISRISRLMYYFNDLKTIKRQDRAFRDLVSIRKKMAKQEWTNRTSRDLAITGYDKLVKKALKNIRNNKTEISSLIETKLKKWERK